MRREAANRVTIQCWYQRQCGAVGGDSSTWCVVCGCAVNAAWPEKHTLNVRPHECLDPLSCPYHGLMVPITPALELEVAVNTTLEKARVEEVNEWTLKQSLFVRRLRVRPPSSLRG